MLPIPLNTMLRAVTSASVLPPIAATLPRLNCKSQRGEQELEKMLNPHTPTRRGETILSENSFINSIDLEKMLPTVSAKQLGNQKGARLQADHRALHCDFDSFGFSVDV
jgi:hypothetical protein